MNLEERAALLREKLRVKGGAIRSERPAGMFAAHTPIEHPKRVRHVVYPTPTGRGFVSLGPSLNSKPAVWVRMPDDKPAVRPRTKHRTGAPALAKIAQTAGQKKLIRAYRNAEEVLAERAQR